MQTLPATSRPGTTTCRPASRGANPKATLAQMATPTDLLHSDPACPSRQGAARRVQPLLKLHAE
eukprot:4270023-Lingulodinium_polyedra.AAC.1